MAKQSNGERLKQYRWKPGQSGNPAGAAKRLSFEAVVAKILDEKIPGTDTSKRETLARVFVDQMLKRNGQMIREYLAREWPAVQKIENVGVEPQSPEYLPTPEDQAMLERNGHGDPIH